MTTAGTPADLALSNPPASERFDTTTAICAGKSTAAAACSSAAMLDPRPEIRMATRRFMSSPCKIEMAVIDHAMFGGGWDHFAQQHDGLAGRRENLGDLLDRIRLHDGDHADAAIEGAQQFEFGDAALLRQPFEHRQDRQPRQIDADAEMLGQHAWNVVGEAAAGDMR